MGGWVGKVRQRRQQQRAAGYKSRWDHRCPGPGTASWARPGHGRIPSSGGVRISRFTQSTPSRRARMAPRSGRWWVPALGQPGARCGMTGSCAVARRPAARHATHTLVYARGLDRRSATMIDRFISVPVGLSAVRQISEIFGVDLDRAKIRPEFENRQVENPMGIATWADLATQNAIEKHNKNKELFCASRPYGVVSRAGRAYISPGRPKRTYTSHLVVFLVHLVVYLGLHLTWSSLHAILSL